MQYLQRRLLCAVLAGLANFRRLGDELGEFVVHSLVPFLCVAEFVAEICTVAGLAATASVGIAARRERLG